VYVVLLTLFFSIHLFLSFLLLLLLCLSLQWKHFAPKWISLSLLLLSAVPTNHDRRPATGGGGGQLLKAL
jgi:hypothetical protein